ncbi:unnamed protein product [Leuciscus chuanchicus]
MDMLPVCSVEKRGFNNMLKVLDARYTVPSRKYFSDVALPQLYNNTRQKIISELKGIYFYAATTDLWSSRTMQPYMCLTVHYVSESWDMLRVCLQTSYFPQDHTGQTIALELKDAMNSLGLSEERITCMTTDSGSNAIRAMKDNNWPNLKCFGHRLHNAVVGKKDGTWQRFRQSWVFLLINYLQDGKYSDPENDELLDMASLMDPRFRTTYITPDKLDIIKKRAVTELSALCSEEEGPAVQMCQEEQSPPAPASLSHQSVKDKIKAELTTYLLGPEDDFVVDTQPYVYYVFI